MSNYIHIDNYSLTDLDLPMDPDYYQYLKDRYKGSSQPNPRCYKIITTDKSYDKLLKIGSQHVNKYEQILRTKCLNKWLSKQGGSFSQIDLNSVVDQYFTTDSSINRDIIEDVMCITAKVLEINGYRDTIEHPILTSPRAIWNTYTADHKSAAGFIRRGDRRDKPTRIEAIRFVQDYFCLTPVIAGIRLKDGKLRGIFNDGIANYFLEAKMFYKWFTWWRNLPYDMHYNDYQIARIILMCHAKESYCADYKGMDIHFGRDAFKATCTMFAYITACDMQELATIHMFCDELFTTDVIAGNRLYRGQHQLLSGLFPTHDPESMQNFSMLVYVCTHIMKFTLVSKPKRLKTNECYICVCGDDSFVLFGRTLTTDERSMLSTSHVEVAAAFGQILEWDKVEHSSETVTFCKKTFAMTQSLKGFKHYSDDIQTPIHKFDLLKAIHCLIEPENMPHFNDLRSYIIWFCSIMDNAYGTIDWKSCVIYIYQHNLELFSKENLSLLCMNAETQEYLNSDWYFRNYVSFDLPSSPTLNLLLSLANN